MNGTPPVHPQAGSAFRRRSREGLGYVSAQRVTGLKWAAVLVVGVAILLGVALATLHYRRDADFRHLIDAVSFRLMSSPTDRRLLLVGDSRIASLACGTALKGWKTLNLGVSGATSDQMAASLERLGSSLPSFQAAILWVGINDIMNTHRSPDEIAGSMQSALATLGPLSSRRLVLGQIGLGPGSAPRVASAVDEKRRDLNARLATMAKEGGYEFLVPFGGERQDDVYADALHLDANGYRRLCAELRMWLGRNGT